MLIVVDTNYRGGWTQIIGGTAMRRRLLDSCKTHFLPIPPAFIASIGVIPSEFRTYLLHHKTTESLGYCAALFCVILHIAVLVQLRHTDRQADRRNDRR